MPTLSEHFQTSGNALPTLSEHFQTSGNALPTLSEHFRTSGNASPTLSEHFRTSGNALLTLSEHFQTSGNAPESLFWPFRTSGNRILTKNAGFGMEKMILAWILKFNSRASQFRGLVGTRSTASHSSTMRLGTEWNPSLPGLWVASTVRQPCIGTMNWMGAHARASPQPFPAITPAFLEWRLLNRMEAA